MIPAAVLASIIGALRWTHIAFGFAAFFMAPVALISAKGGKTHRRWGKFYFYSMTAAATTALVVALYRPNYFLAFTSVFSYYLAFSGYRALSRKRPGAQAAPGDWTAAVLAMAASLALLVLGVLQPTPRWVQIGPVAIAFGSVGAILASANLAKFIRPPKSPRDWLYSHIGGMIGSYIGALTAFSVSTFHFLPLLIRWLWPLTVGIPAIFAWIRYYGRRSKIA